MSVYTVLCLTLVASLNMCYIHSLINNIEENYIQSKRYTTLPI